MPPQPGVRTTKALLNHAADIVVRTTANASSSSNDDTSSKHDPSMLDYIRALPHAVWATFKSLIFAVLLVAGLGLVVACLAAVGFVLLKGLPFSILWCQERWRGWKEKREAKARELEELRRPEEGEESDAEDDAQGGKKRSMDGETLYEGVEG